MKSLEETLPAIFIGTSSHGSWCCKVLPITAEAHTNDLLPLLTALAKDGKEITFFKFDNGPDWNLLNVVNSLHFCKLWRDSELDVMRVCSYAARCSAYNNIEILFFFP